MKSQTARIQLVAISGLVLFLAGCSSVSDEAASDQVELTEPDEAASDQVELTESDEATPDQVELTETHFFSGFEFSVDYPAGWLADTNAPTSTISELEADHELALQEEEFDPQGYGISFDHRDMPFMQELGLPEDPTLDDLLELNRGFFEWDESIEVTELEIFGVPAYSVETDDGSSWGVNLMGIRGDEAFIFGFGAPSEEARAAFLPTWDLMLQSITPTN